MERPRVSIMLPILLLGCLSADIARSVYGREPERPSTSPDRLGKTYTAWETSEDGVIVISGSGRKLLELNPPESENPGNEHREYLEPAVDLAGRTLVFVELAVLFEPGVPLVDAKETATLIEVDLRTRQQRTLMTVPGGHLGSPAYSPSGDRLALLLERDLLVLDAETKSVIAKLPNALMGPVSPRYNRADIRWNPFATNRISIDSSRNCGIHGNEVHCGGPGEIEIEGSVARWPNSDSSVEESKSAAKVLEEVGKPTRPYGTWSTRGRFYFYYASSEGFFCREWIEGFDLKKRRTFHVRTLQRHFYCD